MDIKKTGSLTTEEIEQIIKTHLEKEGINVGNIYFDIANETAKGDYFDEYPTVPRLKGVSFSIK
jgi:hypothetical protein